MAAFMIAEIVSNGMLTLPNAMAVVGAHYHRFIWVYGSLMHTSMYRHRALARAHDIPWRICFVHSEAADRLQVKSPGGSQHGCVIAPRTTASQAILIRLLEGTRV